MRYKTAKKYYPILVRLWNFRVDIENWWWSLRKYKPIYYLQDLLFYIKCDGLKGITGCDFYFWHMRPLVDKLICFTYTLLGCYTGLKVVGCIMNDCWTKLLHCTPIYSYTRSHGAQTRYYTCQLYPFNYIKLTRTMFSCGDQQGINTYNTAVYSLVTQEDPGEITQQTEVLYKGFLTSRRQITKLYRTYKIDLLRKARNEA